MKIRNQLFSVVTFVGLFLTSCSPEPEGIVFKKEEFGDKWPFKVDEIDVFCDGYKELYAVADGVTYALNGSATGSVDAGKNEVTDRKIDEIQLKNPDFPDSYMLIPSEIFEKGLKHCETVSE